MFLPLLTTLILSQAPADGAAVLICGRTGVTPERSEEIAADVEQVLRDAQLPITMSSVDARQRVATLPECGANRKCVAERATALGVPTVVAVYAAQVLSDLALHLELVSSAKGEVLTQDDVIVPAASRSSALKGPMAKFASAANAAFAQRAEQRAHAEQLAKREAMVGDTGVPPSSGVTATESTGRPMWILAPGVIGVGLLAAGGYLFSQDLSAVNQLNTGHQTLNRTQAGAIRDWGETDEHLAWVFTGVGVAAVTTTVILYLVEGHTDTPVTFGPSATGWGVSAAGRF